MKKITTPIDYETIKELKVGDIVYLSGDILCGRDAALPRVVDIMQGGEPFALAVNLQGSVVFHTAVSPAGVGPTSSNKKDIESSMGPLSALGVRMHIGKGAIGKDTVELLHRHNSVFAIIPPVTALLESKTLKKTLLAFPELGMEALYMLTIDRYPIIIGAAHGKSIYD